MNKTGCENRSMGNTSTVVTPQCWDNKAVCFVTVVYNEVERDSFWLCRPCAEALERDAEGHGYEVTR